MTVTEALEARRAVPSFDPSVEISREELERLIDLACLAPSSMNLQPWEFLVCLSQEDKDRLRGVSMNQKKVGEASAVIALVCNLDFYKHAEIVTQGAVDRGYYPEERRQGYIDAANGFPLKPQAMREEAIRSSNLWAMAFMLVAKEAGWDTGPMGGFDADGIAKEFGLPDTKFVVLLITVGKINPDVKLLQRNIRFKAKELVHYGNW